MDAGDSMQAIIPSDLAWGTKGVCIDGKGWLIEPGSTLVYDMYLKKSSGSDSTIGMHRSYRILVNISISKW